MAKDKKDEKFIGCRIPASEADTFETKVGKRNVSEALRALILKFNNGEVKIEKTVVWGG